ncbi:porin [Myroides sp. 1354]|uniref:porin n=1 Tax=unclassified Myroides TaxID=2642485 RepID=UPI002576AB10|nr:MULTISPECIES: porin [unclassified Myroides]MDM1046175.1 porin [Myroides sp. R163-1]MDM1057109.1 porin [Myroides sp. 1354]MDM1070306.1 porin [Myroides sp. 1372]
MKNNSSVIKSLFLCGIGLFTTMNSLGQERLISKEHEVAQDTIRIFEDKIVLNDATQKYPQFKVGGVFQTRYLDNFKRGVDINGLHYGDGQGTNNSFEIKRMRVSMNAKVTENLEVVALVNLADFKSDPKTKVLENAYAKYTINRYLQFTVGQFRPLFGMEETYPVDVVKSIDYSNSYYMFGDNGWTSFQIGAAVTGSVDLGSIPMSYGVSVTNGNGKNKTDNDDGKHYSSRLLFNVDPKHKINVGISGGVGEVQRQTVYAVGAEATAFFSMGDRWSIDFQLEAKQGTNHFLYFGQPVDQRIGDMKDYLMKSFYVLPNVRYELGKKRLQAIEFACRYEYLDGSAHLNSNGRQTWVPMVSLEFLKNYGARLQVGMQIDNYKTNIEHTKSYNSNLAFIQFQCRLQ